MSYPPEHDPATIPQDPERSGTLPTRVDATAVLRFIELWMRDGLTISEAAEIAGVTDRTVRNWRASDWWPSAMMMAEAQLRDEMLGAAMSALYKSAREGNVKAAAALANTLISLQKAAPVRAPGVGMDRRHGVASLGPTTAKRMEDLSDEELRQLAYEEPPR